MAKFEMKSPIDAYMAEKNVTAAQVAAHLGISEEQFKLDIQPFKVFIDLDKQAYYFNAIDETAEG